MPNAYGTEWTCPTCSVIRYSNFCPTCGEEVTTAGYLTLRGFAGQLFSALTSVDSRLVRSFRNLLVRPGALTASYRDGQRKQYFLPMNLFLFANGIFFAVQSAASVKVFSAPLEMHLYNQFWSPVAAYLVNARLHATGTTLKEFFAVFDQATALNARTLIGLVVPVFALLLPPKFFRSKQSFVVHAVFVGANGRPDGEIVAVRRLNAHQRVLTRHQLCSRMPTQLDDHGRSAFDPKQSFPH